MAGLEQSVDCGLNILLCPSGLRKLHLEARRLILDVIVRVLAPGFGTLVRCG